MSWMGKIIGGTIGFAVGGPVGAAIGAAIGHGVDAVSDDGEEGIAHLPEWIHSLEYLQDDAGISLQFALSRSLPENSGAVVRIQDSQGTYCRAQRPFLDDDGDFIAFGELDGQSCRAYIPFGALLNDGAGEYQVSLALLDSNDHSVIALNVFTMPFPGRSPFRRCRWLEPLIRLCMRVVLADGRVLSPEVRHVRQYFRDLFELNDADLQELRVMMKEPLVTDLEGLLQTIDFRMPLLSVGEILTLLADISKCDSDVHPAEVAEIRQVALALGMPSAEWPDVRRELGLDAGDVPPDGDRRNRSEPLPRSPGVPDPYEVLGVSRTATRAEILAAYRNLVSQYHPDRVSTLPQEFQDLAHRKMTEINAAWDELKRR